MLKLYDIQPLAVRILESNKAIVSIDPNGIDQLPGEIEVTNFKIYCKKLNHVKDPLYFLYTINSSKNISIQKIEVSIECAFDAKIHSIQSYWWGYSFLSSDHALKNASLLTISGVKVILYF